MSRILGIDYGMSKTGIAISDPLKIISRDYEVIFRKSDEEKVQRIAVICKKEDVEKIIIGLPLNMDGTEGFQSEHVKAFAKRLSFLNRPIVFIDERMSTKIAEEIMREMKYSSDDILKRSDAKAASVILQDYLDYQS